jgi:hypothetical protein
LGGGGEGAGLLPPRAGKDGRVPWGFPAVHVTVTDWVHKGCGMGRVRWGIRAVIAVGRRPGPLEGLLPSYIHWTPGG